MPQINTVIINNTTKTWDLFYKRLSIPENLKLLGWRTISDKVEVIHTFKTLEELKKHYGNLGYTYANCTKKDENGYAIDMHECGDSDSDGDCVSSIEELRKENTQLQDQIKKILEMNKNIRDENILLQDQVKRVLEMNENILATMEKLDTKAQE